MPACPNPGLQIDGFYLAPKAYQGGFATASQVTHSDHATDGDADADNLARVRARDLHRGRTVARLVQRKAGADAITPGGAAEDDGSVRRDLRRV